MKPSSVQVLTAPRKRPTAAETRSKFLRKVELLEGWAREGGVPPGMKWPRGPTDLARWNDSALNVECWESPNVAAPNGKYSDLRSRFDTAVRLLLAAAGTGEKDRDRIRKLELAKKILTEQVLTLACRIRDLERELLLTEDQLRISERSEAELRAQLATIKPFKITKA